MTTFTTKVAVDVEVHQVWCGHFVAMTERQWADKREKGDTFYCPVGDTCAFTESDNAKLRKALAAEQERVSALSAQHATALKERNALLDERNRITKRIKNGVCIQCHRTFRQLARHMKMKHGTPDERAAEIAAH